MEVLSFSGVSKEYTLRFIPRQYAGMSCKLQTGKDEQTYISKALLAVAGSCFGTHPQRQGSNWEVSEAGSLFVPPKHLAYTQERNVLTIKARLPDDALTHIAHKIIAAPRLEFEEHAKSEFDDFCRKLGIRVQ